MFLNCFSSRTLKKTMGYLFFKTKVYCGKPCEKFINLLKSNNIVFTIGKIENLDVNGDLLTIQTIYVIIRNDNEFMLFNKISGNKNFVYKICSVKPAHRYYISYMSVEKSEDKACFNYYDCKIIEEYTVYSSAMKAYKIACTVHNDETTIGVIHKVYDAETSRKANKTCFMSELISCHHGKEKN